MDIKRSQCKLSHMEKKKTGTRDPRSDLLTSPCVAACKIAIIFNFFHDFPSIVPNTTHTHTRAQKDFLLSFLAHTENLNRNTGRQTRSHENRTPHTHGCTETQSISSHKHLKNRTHPQRAFSQTPRKKNG